MKYIALVVALLFCPVVISAEIVIEGIVSKVHDGDSIHIMTSAGRIKIRLSGIDTPEIKQAFGIEARNILRALILDKEASARCHKIDRYKRQVCVVYLDDRDINLFMVESGFAWHFKKYQDEQSEADRISYSVAEDVAKHKGIGLWQDKESIPPWEFRKL